MVSSLSLPLYGFVGPQHVTGFAGQNRPHEKHAAAGCNDAGRAEQGGIHHPVMFTELKHGTGDLYVRRGAVVLVLDFHSHIPRYCIAHVVDHALPDFSAPRRQFVTMNAFAQ